MAINFGQFRVTEPLNSFRWYAEVAQMPLRLQQAYRDVNNGKIVWKDVLTVVGKEYEQTSQTTSS